MNVTNAPQFACSPADAHSIDALYLHVPFCAHKCHYCDFYSITRQTPDRMDRFVDLLLAEADRWLGSAADHRPKPRTVFFGGGTPSLLPFHTMDRLLTGLKARLDLAAAEEWTIEINPATADEAYFKMLLRPRRRSPQLRHPKFRSQGSRPPRTRPPLRRHRRKSSTGPDGRLFAAEPRPHLRNPRADLASWRSRPSMRHCHFNTPHVSCYSLTYESNTPMAVRKRLGAFHSGRRIVGNPMLALRPAQRFTDGRHVAYEISNYAISGEACRHNLIYWTGGNYIGLGPVRLAACRRPPLAKSAAPWRMGAIGVSGERADADAEVFDPRSPRRRTGDADAAAWRRVNLCRVCRSHGSRRNACLCRS